MGTENFDKTISIMISGVLILFLVQIIFHYSVLFIVDLILFIYLLKSETTLSVVLHKMATSSSYYFETPYFLIPWGIGALIFGIIGVVCLNLGIVPHQNFVATYLYTMLLSLTFFLFSNGLKCILLGSKIITFKFTRRGFFGFFQRVFILIRSFAVSLRWICYFCDIWPIPSILTIIAYPKTFWCCVYIVLKCILLLWLLWDLVSTIRDYNVNSKVAFQPAPPELVNDPCIICTLWPKEPVMLSCGHIFCYECAYRWLMSNPTCPLCRHSIAERKNIEFADGSMPFSTYLSVF